MRFNRYSIVLTLVFAFAFGWLTSKEIKPDAAYSYINVEYELKEDGSIVYKRDSKLKILTGYAMNRVHGESFIVYNTDWQELKILKSETITEEGDSVPTPANGYNEVLPRFVSKAPPYFNLREMVVSHTGLKISSQIDFSYQITSKPGFFPGLIGKVLVGSRDFVNEMNIRVIVPESEELNFNFANDGPKPKFFKKGGKKVYVWTIKNAPPIPEENGQPKLEDFMPVLYFSTASSADLVNHILQNRNDLFALDETAKETVDNIIEDKTGRREKAFALSRYVHKNIGVAGGKLKYFGYKPRPAQITFDRNAGTSLDRTVILAAMLREAGLKADILMAASDRGAKNDLSLLSQFGTPLTYCYPQNEKEAPIILNPNVKQIKPKPKALDSKPAFVLVKRKIYFIPPEKEESELFFDGEINIYSDFEGTCNAKMSFSGAYMPSLYNEEANAIIKSGFSAQNWEAEVEPSELNYSNFNSIKRNVETSLTRKPKKEAGLYFLTLPIPPKSILSRHIKLVQVSRTTPFELEGVVNETINYEIKLPENLELASEQIAVSKSADLGSVEIKIEDEEGKIRIHKKLIIEKEIIEPDKYNQLYELLVDWLDNDSNRIILKEVDL